MYSIWSIFLNVILHLDNTWISLFEVSIALGGVSVAIFFIIGEKPFVQILAMIHFVVLSLNHIYWVATDPIYFWTLFVLFSIYTPFLYNLFHNEILSHSKKIVQGKRNRHMVGVPVVMEFSNGKKVEARTFELSPSGAFISLPLRSLRPITMGEKVSVKFTLAPFRVYQAEAEMIRATHSKGRYPEGIGIHFRSVPDVTRAKLVDTLEEAPFLP